MLKILCCKKCPVNKPKIDIKHFNSLALAWGFLLPFVPLHVCPSLITLSIFDPSSVCLFNPRIFNPTNVKQGI